MGILERAYRKDEIRYVYWLAFLLALAAMGFVLLIVLTLAGYLGRPIAEMAPVLLGGWLLLWAALIPGGWMARRDAQPLFRWLRQGKPASQAQEAWLALIRLPFQALLRTAALISLTTTINCFYAASVLDTGLHSVPVFFIGVQVTIAAGIVFLGFSAEIGLGPVRRDAAEQLADDFRFPRARFGVRSKALSALIATTSLTALVTGGTVAITDDPLTGLVLGVFAGLVVTLTLAGVLAGMVTSAVLAPVRELLRGTRRIDAGKLDKSVLVMTTDELGELSRDFNLMQAGLRERASLHAAMGAYIDPEIAERVMAEGSTISGEAAEVTVMFVDIVGYTAMAEDAQPEKVVSDLNEFFEIVVPAIVKHGGHANKLLGDGLMAVFGVPHSLAQHADCALAAAREIQTLLSERYARSLKAGIGLNSGSVVVGSMGGGPKLDYTIIGDAVNVAARIEAFTRHTGDEILLTGATKDLLTSPDGLEPRGRHSLKGRATTVEVWAG
jgi:class 3 adenylate cyclase